MSFYKNIEIKLVHVSKVREFIEANHYSRSIKGVKNKYVFAAYLDSELVGAVLYGCLSTTAWKKYSEKEDSVIELRRMVSTVTERNFLSWFVSSTIRFLKNNTDIDLIVSYADPEYGHTGFIYQALNFEYHGKTNKDKVLIDPDGNRYHSRSLRVKYKGKLKPFAQRLLDMKEKGLLVEKEVSGKHIYVYPLRRDIVRTQYPKS